MTNSWTATFTFDIDMSRVDFMNYLDSCLDFDILDGYQIHTEG